MNAARMARRPGAKKGWLVYRRMEVEMPAKHEEVEHAQEEGIEFIFLTSPVKVIGLRMGG